MALYTMTAEAAARPLGPTDVTKRLTMLLLYPRAKAGRGGPGLNSGLPASRLGEGRFLFDGQPARLIAWCVPLSDDCMNFDQTVSTNLRELLSAVCPVH